jgi:hypothetical protein
MFTLLNIINYFSGKYVSTTMLILISIGIYYYIITNWYSDLLSNDYLITILLLLLLLDITSIIVIYAYSDLLESSNKNIDITILNDNNDDNKNKKNKKQKTKKSHKKKYVNSGKNNTELIKNNNNIINDKSDNNENKEIISLYDNNKPASIHTFVKFT